MNQREEKVFKETRLRNLERWFSKMIQHPELVEECMDIESEINALREELKSY